MGIHDILIGLAVFGLVVFIHELGHFLAARLRGVPVEVFSIGFGPSLLKWRDRSGTLWKIGMLPLGGYVAFHGMMPEEPEEGASPPTPPLEEGAPAKEGAVGATDGTPAAVHPQAATPAQTPSAACGNAGEDKQGAPSHTCPPAGYVYDHEPVSTRALVAVAGPAFNFFLAIGIFAFMFALGCMPGNHPPTDVATIMPQSAAKQAGLAAGDHIAAVDGQKVGEAADLQALLSKRPGQHVTLDVVRAGHNMAVPVTLGTETVNGQQIGRLGIVFARDYLKPVPWWQAVPRAVSHCWDLSTGTLAVLWQMLTGQRDPHQLSGALGIMHMSGQAAEGGMVALILFMGLLSAHLGLFNLLPVPMLDGGHLVFHGLEAIRRKPVHPTVRARAFQVGLVLVLALYLFTTYNDLHFMGLFHWVAHFFTHPSSPA
ncbi:RIP metalloprotease RseP [Formicincola oecophyllae]|uniref:Zinc metalloprotease n=1 Tax=Formicincola oecophyllae TaxID=2558361 RepID=A0A4Y6UBN5_9PROT|nr:RIP metalloprotease RseP [Formicincola oecophyllae]QDH13886.1 RIP metalloprotease RseP [Formicincola oecophyllae]